MFAENDVIFLSKFAMIEDVNMNTRQMNLQSFKLALYDMHLQFKSSVKM